jgi:hypothetical protein
MLTSFLSTVIKACCRLADYFTADDQADQTPDLAILAG